MAGDDIPVFTGTRPACAFVLRRAQAVVSFFRFGELLRCLIAYRVYVQTPGFLKICLCPGFGKPAEVLDDLISAIAVTGTNFVSPKE